MTLTEIVEGLLILKPYYNKEYVVGAEHDEIFTYPTDRPLPEDDVKKLEALGWFQPKSESHYQGSEWTAADYKPNAGWKAFP